MNNLIDRVRHYAARHSLWTPQTRVVAAVSGGSDSVALAFLLRDLAARDQLIFAGLAHLNHHVRGEDAGGDAMFCRALADRLGVAAIIGDADVPGDAKAHQVSLEVAGRHARQRFFKEAIESIKADCVAVAHTRDDQAETVILRLARGAGSSGLAAMMPRRDHVIRPLLDSTRPELQEYLRAINEMWREDSTNLDRSIPRNRVRHAVMPELRAINAQADAALARAAELLRGDDEFLEKLANAAFVRIVEAEGDPATVTINSAEFLKLPLAVARRVSRYALETANPARTYGLEEADELRHVLDRGLRADISSVVVERFGANAVLSIKGARAASQDPFEQRLEIPGTVESPRGAWTVTAEGPMAPTASFSSDANKVVIDASRVGSHLIVRHRRPGDRMHPLGAPGRRKVQDVLVDRKVPRDDRDAVPIVTTKEGDIVWVAGEVLADPFRVTPLTKSVVVLTLRR
ncbi:MAG TPA: tRNA lysidine(34) synthetase TilS [Vicinamibacterales bacterium]|nr:tRNA lysidine(34) synthetase TilS [Vicinamibacterales bacterium]